MVKLNRKKLLKEPDEFLTFSEQAVAWSKQNAKLLMGVAVCLALAVAAWVGIGTYMEHRQDRAADALASSFENYSKAVEGKADQAQEKAARESLAKVVDQYGSTAAGLQARLALGDLLVEKAKYADAEKVFKDLSADSGLPPAMGPLAWHGLGLSLEGQQKYTDAAVAYEKAMKEAGPTLRNSYRLDLARVQEAAGQKSAAIKTYREAVANPPDPSSLDMVKSRLVVLGVDPVTMAKTQ